MIDLLIIGLATWYVSYALSSTHGPGGVFDWIREHVWHGRRGAPVYGTWEHEGVTHETEKQYPHNGLLDCPVCLAFWAALLLLLLPMGVVTQALGLAGGAMILHSWAGWRFAQ